MKQIPTSFNLQEDESYDNYDDYNIESNKSELPISESESDEEEEINLDDI